MAEGMVAEILARRCSATLNLRTILRDPVSEFEIERERSVLQASGFENCDEALYNRLAGRH